MIPAIKWHPSFAPASQIDYLKNIDEELIDIWGSNEGLEDVARALAASIKVGGFDEEQYFLLIPPGEDAPEWRYWEFASWIPGESPFNDLTHYFTETLAFIKKSAAEEGLIESDIIIDYTLRDQLFALDWENAYTTAADLFLHNKTYVIYASFKKVDNAKQALTLYFEQAFNKMPLLPLVYPELIDVMDKDYLNTILQKFKQ